jgi:hypothetical protein
MANGKCCGRKVRREYSAIMTKCYHIRAGLGGYVLRVYMVMVRTPPEYWYSDTYGQATCYTPVALILLRIAFDFFASIRKVELQLLACWDTSSEEYLELIC